MSFSPAPFFGADRASFPGPVPALSVVLPMYNEAGGAAALIAEIAEELAEIDHEIIAVDDASTDATAEVLTDALAKYPQLRILRHSRNSGQSRALRTGILGARAAVIATMDGDGQNVPSDVPRLYRHLMRPDAPSLLALVGGVRQQRKDTWTKRFASGLANKVRKALLHDDAADTGCGLKVFKREAFLRLPYFDHVHRYVPALIIREGCEAEYLPVSHRARQFGQSKYTNLGRAAVAIRDLIGVSWLIARSKDPGQIEERSFRE